MGISPLNAIVLEDNEKCQSNTSSDGSNLLNKVLEEAAQAKRRWHVKSKCRRSPARRVVMKRRRVLLEGSRRSTRNGIERKVRTLKKMIPNSKEAIGLEGLFRETADYILALQMRVKIMQVMVKMLSGSDGDDHDE